MNNLKALIILIPLIITFSSCTERNSETLENSITDDTLPYNFSRIIAPDSIFVKTMKVELVSSKRASEVFYTLDGSSPTQSSSRYRGPILLKESATLKAQTYYRGKKIGGIVEKNFKKVLPRPSFSTRGLFNGLTYEYFEGEWEKLPIFTDIEPLLTGITQNVDLGIRQQDENFGLRITGYIRVNRDDVYQFALLSDDGSRLYIGNKLIVDNDGVHKAKEKIGSVALARGVHPFTLEYFNQLGEKELRVRIAEIGGKLRDIVSEDLYYKQ